jgi:hypothetical protein
MTLHVLLLESEVHAKHVRWHNSFTHFLVACISIRAKNSVYRALIFLMPLVRTLRLFAAVALIKVAMNVEFHFLGIPRNRITDTELALPGCHNQLTGLNTA